MPGYPAFPGGNSLDIWRQREAGVAGAGDRRPFHLLLLTAALAARLAPSQLNVPAWQPPRFGWRRCALFLANYTAALLYFETLATFFTVAALSLLACAFWRILACVCRRPRSTPTRSCQARDGGCLAERTGWRWNLGCALDAPLVLAAAWHKLYWSSWHRHSDAMKLLLAGACITAGLLLALLLPVERRATREPWAASNSLSPRYRRLATAISSPRGFFAWTRTWSEHFRDAYQVSWKLGKQRIEMDSFPTSAFDSGEERNQVAELITRYNVDLKMTPALDREFERLARERSARHPFQRLHGDSRRHALPRSGSRRASRLLPYSGRLMPPLEMWRGNPRDFGATTVFVLKNAVNIGLALAAWIRRRRTLLSDPAIVMLTAFIVIRTAFLTSLQTVEPRYVMVCFPALLAIGAQAWAARVPTEQSAAYSKAAAAEFLAPGNTEMRFSS